MCLIYKLGHSCSLTFKHDPHLLPLPGQGEEDAKRLVRVDPVVMTHKLGMPSAHESLSTSRRIEFHQSS